MAFGGPELSDGGAAGALTYAAGGGATILFLRVGFEAAGIGAEVAVAATAAAVVVVVVVIARGGLV